jgi:hypothetical protein
MGDASRKFIAPLKSRAHKDHVPALGVGRGALNLLQSLVLRNHHDDSYYDATDIGLVALLGRVCDVFSAQINEERSSETPKVCHGTEGKEACHDCKGLRPELGPAFVTESTLLAGKLAIEPTPKRRPLG